MMHLTTSRQPMFSLTFVVRFVLALTVVLGTAHVAAGQTSAQASWERKLDGTLQAQLTTDVDADALHQVTVRLTSAVAATKAARLARLGFPVVATVDARTIVVTLSAREAMVLAEDADLQSFTLQAADASAITAQ